MIYLLNIYPPPPPIYTPSIYDDTFLDYCLIQTLSFSDLKQSTHGKTSTKLCFSIVIQFAFMFYIEFEC